MHFGLTEEQALLQASVRDFAGKELPPPRLRELFDEGAGFDAAFWRGAAEMGLHGLLVPERFGGAGLEMLEQALVCEVLGEFGVPGPFLSNALATLALCEAGSEAQQAHWLPRLALGDVIASVALAEPVGGGSWEPGDWTTRSGGGALAGRKRFVEHAAEADVLIVGVEKGGLGLVEKGAAGLKIEPIDGLDRTRSLFEVSFDQTPFEPLAGCEGVAERMLDAGRVLAAADAFGAAWKLIRLTIEYALTREQFGTPIAQFQAVKHHLADLATDAEAMRGLVWYAAYALDHLPDEAPRDAAHVKAHVTDRSVHIGRSAVELHGGIGFTWECDVQFWVKRTMFDRAWLGTPAVQRERAARLAGW
jgi:alkylation response protein AidB-like acyl-CoA dehydrogenase